MLKLTIDRFEIIMMQNLAELYNYYNNERPPTRAVADIQKQLEDFTATMSKEEKKAIEIRANKVAYAFLEAIGVKVQITGIDDTVKLPQPIITKVSKYGK